MIKFDAVTAEIKDILVTDRNGMKKSQKDKMKRRYLLLELVKKYLETEPNEDFVKKEKARLAKRISLINDGFGAWLAFGYNKQKGEDYKQQRAAYDKEQDTKHLKDQLKAIEFILQ